MALIVYIKIEQPKFIGNDPTVDCSRYLNVTKNDVRYLLSFYKFIKVIKINLLMF